MKTLLTALSLGICIDMCAQQPDSAKYYYKAGLNEKAGKKFLLASNAFDKAIKFDPAFTEAILENALTNLDMNRPDAAIAMFIKVLANDPANKVAVNELMMLYFNYHQYAKAIELAGKNPGNEKAVRITGISYYNLEDYGNAEKFLNLAISKNSLDAEATYTLARTYLDMEQYTKAVPWYEKAIKLAGAKNTWMNELGMLYYTLDDFKKAVKSFTAASDNGYAETNEFMENLGYAQLYSGDYENGEKVLMKLYAKKSGDKDILRALAEILYKEKQYDKSLTYCQKLMEMDAKDGKALYQAGLNFQKKGEKGRGQEMCDKAIEMDPTLDNLRKRKEVSLL